MRAPSVVFKAASIDLTHQIKPDEQSPGLISRRVIEECRIRSGTLRDDGSRVVGKSQREGVPRQAFLNTEAVSGR
jgi:hypothetical protein